ncbi:FtsX-like permease family protein [Treponema sp.]|uniref:ABC transporter permease n=1 Tax=Treponema sp. TaxID=166 RepID=UPI0025F8B549|nr:FtsX-like permease family protein [Treponema sp.]MCR5217750.1 FtsX-like permease family protein [Treponema sp.]
MFILKLALRSFIYRRKQYFSLFLVCAAGCGISLFFLSVTKGMMASLSDKARIYYGGDYQIIGGTNELGCYNTTDFIKGLEDIFPEGSVISPRFDYDAARASFYFEGNSARQRVVKGVDFKKEKRLLSSINLLEGSIENVGRGGILLSSPVASMLCASEGDKITFMAPAFGGGVNTIDLYVRGIFEDSSLFGMYTSYMDLDDLRQLLCTGHDYSNRICLDLNGANISKEDTKKYHSQLSKRIKMFPLVDDKQIFYDHLLSGKFKEDNFALVPLQANLQDVKILIVAMKAITSFIIGILVLIIIVGIGSTFKILVMKRINEIGIYMSLGMNRAHIMLTILTEAVILVLAGSFAGILLSLLLSRFISIFNFSFIPAFDIFLKGGAIIPLPDMTNICIICLSVLFFTIAAVTGSVRKSIRIMPCKALAVTE